MIMATVICTLTMCSFGAMGKNKEKACVCASVYFMDVASIIFFFAELSGLAEKQ